MSCWSAAVTEGSATAEEHGHISNRGAVSEGQTPGGPAKELEELRQSLDTQDSAVDWLEADKRQLQQRLLEADEKLEKSVKVVQTLVLRNLELAARAAGVDQIGSTTRRSTCGANWTKPGARWSS
ncbi:Hypothetical predicted protein [Cloeon dipterum]|uniref:Uncharacterized protein n=1 Tax=Cloeon dipterum TaxID=197152 RepID=A0A8S1DYU1_9INSE|nr:Hypothetical predicted protein [Cloeon dipterum]